MYRILVIEDEPGLLQDITYSLERNGYEVINAEDGATGIQLAQEHPPDLIICDIMMPEINGYQVLQELHSNSHTAAIPFIFLTALADPDEIRKGMSLGADDYLTKPFKHPELLRAIQARLARTAQQEQALLRQAAQKLIQTQEFGYSQLAQRLQEEVGQVLANLKLALTMGDRGTEAAQKLVESAIGATQAISFDLHPHFIKHIGLLPSILWLCERLRQEQDFTLEVQHFGLNRDFPNDFSYQIYRLLQTLSQTLSQLAKIGHLEMWYEQDFNLRLSIQNSSLGIEGFLRETNFLLLLHRATLLGGWLEAASAAHQGIEIRFRCVIQEEPALKANSFPPPLPLAIPQLISETPLSLEYRKLTPREKEIFILVAEGHTSAAIAYQLHISVRTVETHRANLMHKLDVHSQAELVRQALQWGLIH